MPLFCAIQHEAPTISVNGLIAIFITTLMSELINAFRPDSQSLRTFTCFFAARELLVIYFLVYLWIYMGRPLMIQEKDERRIESLKKRLGIQRKVDVLRAGIDLLEKEAERRERVSRWRKAAALVAGTSRKINAEFQSHSRMKRI